MRTVSRIALAMFALFLTSVAMVALSAPANATDYYRYWSYFNVKADAYVFSKKGVGVAVPNDGTIDAYRYAASKDFNKPNLPRIDLAEVTFDAVCGDTAAVDGEKRVAVVIDYGVEEDANGQDIPDPTVGCAQVATNATGLQVLQSVAEVRTKSSSLGPLLCGIEGYPAKGCADEVTNVATPADAGFLTVSLDDGSADAKDEDDGDSNTPLYVGLGVLVAALLGGGIFVSRRNKNA